MVFSFVNAVREGLIFIFIFFVQTMGFGLPAAIGAKVAAPEKIVVDIDGDASFSMTAMELATASQYNIGVKVLVLNNEFQGMVVQWQGPLLSPLHLSLFF